MNALFLHFQTYWRRYLRWLLWTFGVICILILISWGIMAWYIKTHKQQLIDKLVKGVNEQTGGELAIKDLSLTLWEDFPHLSVALTDVSLHDSLYDKHGMALADIKNIYLRTGLAGLLKKQISVNKIIISGGNVHLFTDSGGYSNKYLLQAHDTAKKDKKGFFVKAFLLQDVAVTISDVPKNKAYDLHINFLEGHGTKRSKFNRYRLQTDMLIGGLGFNLAAGKYLEKTPVEGPLILEQYTETNILNVRSAALAIEKVPLQLQARLDFGHKPAIYEIHLSGKKVDFEKAKKWLTEKIRSKLEALIIKDPVILSCDLSGLMKFRDTPAVHVAWNLENNTLNTVYGLFTKTSFTGDFSNRVKAGAGHADNNSAVRILKYKANLSGIPISGDSIRVDNLSYPLVNLHVKSSFPAESANQLGGPDFPFRFTRGRADAEIHYRGGVRSTDTLYPQLNGYARISDLAFVYIPRGVGVTNLNALMNFQGDDLYLKDVNINSRAGRIRMEGSAAHFFRFYFTQPGKVALTWNATSDDVDLSIVNAFIGQRKKLDAVEREARRRNSGRKVSGALSQLNKVLEESSAHLGVDFKKIKYRNFTATQLLANVTLNSEFIQVSQLKLNHAGGSISAVGKIQQKGRHNPFQVDAKINQVDVSRLFFAFENFGQDAITDKIISGRITADAHAQGVMSDGGGILNKEMEGKVTFRLDKGRLENFGPFLKISKFIFKNRGLDDVQFEKLEDSLIFERGKIIIPPLHIQSTAFNMLVQGVYFPPEGTNISITLPLGNPEGNNRWKRKGKVGPGIVIHLVARDGKDGSVKIGWDASKKGKREAEEMFDEEEDVPVDGKEK